MFCSVALMFKQQYDAIQSTIHHLFKILLQFNDYDVMFCKLKLEIICFPTRIHNKNGSLKLILHKKATVKGMLNISAVIYIAKIGDAISLLQD